MNYNPNPTPNHHSCAYCSYSLRSEDAKVFKDGYKYYPLMCLLGVDKDDFKTCKDFTEKEQVRINGRGHTLIGKQLFSYIKKNRHLLDIHAIISFVREQEFKGVFVVRDYDPQRKGSKMNTMTFSEVEAELKKLVDGDNLELIHGLIPADLEMRYTNYWKYSFSYSGLWWFKAGFIEVKANIGGNSSDIYREEFPHTAKFSELNIIDWEGSINLTFYKRTGYCNDYKKFEVIK